MLRLALPTLLFCCTTFVAAEEEKPKTTPTPVGPATLQVPSKWVKQKATRMFRILQWGVPKSEGDENNPVCYVSELRGGGGSPKDNLKRWEGEYSKKDAEAKTETFEADGMKISMIEIAGTFKESMGGPFAPGGKVEYREGYATLAAFIEVPGAEAGYSIKLVGAKKSVLAQKKLFAEMLKTAKKSS